MQLINASHWHKLDTQTYTTLQTSCFDFSQCKHCCEPFAWITKTHNRILAVRDHFGIEPFFYTIENKRLIFGSTPSDILSYMQKKPDWHQRLNTECFPESLLPPFPPVDTQTQYQDIFRLLPGHSLEIKQGNATQKPFWQLNPNAKAHKVKNDTEVLETFASLLEEAISCYATDKTGIEFSGGFDSSAIITTAKNMQLAFDLFTHIDETNKPSMAGEKTFREILTKQLNLKNHFKLGASKPSAHQELTNIYQMIGCLFPILVAPLQNNIYEAVKTQQCNVLLSGFGGDECVSSYARNRDYYRQFSDNKRLKTILKLVKALYHHEDKYTNLVKQWLLKPKNSPQYSYPSIRHYEHARMQGRESFNFQMRIEYSAMIAKKMGFAYRYPLLYPPLVSYCFHLPTKYKRRGTIRRWLIQQYLAPYRNPSSQTKLTGSITPAMYDKYLTQFSINRSLTPEAETKELLFKINEHLLGIESEQDHK